MKTKEKLGIVYFLFASLVTLIATCICFMATLKWEYSDIFDEVVEGELGL